MSAPAVFSNTLYKASFSNGLLPAEKLRAGKNKMPAYSRTERKNAHYRYYR